MNDPIAQVIEMVLAPSPHEEEWCELCECPAGPANYCCAGDECPVWGSP